MTEHQRGLGGTVQLLASNGPAAAVRSLAAPKREWAAVSALVAGTALHALPAFRQPVATLDEIVVLDYPDAVGRGATPNADFYTVYGRLGYDFLSHWYQVIGYTPVAERLAGLLYQLAVVLGVWVLGHRFGPLAAIASGGLAVLLMPFDLTAFAWMGGLALAVWAVALASRGGGAISWTVAGVLAGLSVGWRYEMAVVVGLPLLALIYRHPRARWVLLGGFAGFLPTALHLLDNGQLAWDNVTARMGVNFQLETGSVPVHVALGLLVGAASLVVLVCRAFWRRTREDWAWALLCLAVVPQALQRVDVYHFAFAAVIVYPLALAAGVDLARVDNLRTRRFLAPALVTFLTVPALFFLAWLAASSTPIDKETVESDSRRITIPAERAGPTRALIRDVRALVPPGSAIFVGTDQMGRTSFNSFPVYYLLSEHYRFDSYYLELAAGVAERDGSGLSDDIRSADALVLSAFDPAVGDRLFPHAPSGFTEHDRTVREHFRQVSSHGPLTLYVRRPERR